MRRFVKPHALISYVVLWAFIGVHALLTAWDPVGIYLGTEVSTRLLKGFTAATLVTSLAVAHVFCAYVYDNFHDRKDPDYGSIWYLILGVTLSFTVMSENNGYSTLAYLITHKEPPTGPGPAISTTGRLIWFGVLNFAGTIHLAQALERKWQVGLTTMWWLLFCLVIVVGYCIWG